MGLHPSEILIGFEKGATKALELLEGIDSKRIEDLRDKDSLKLAIKTPVASK
jgi:hypothetical protein